MSKGMRERSRWPVIVATMGFKDITMAESFSRALPPLSEEQEVKAALLTDEEIKIIDQGLLSNTSTLKG